MTASRRYSVVRRRNVSAKACGTSSSTLAVFRRCLAAKTRRAGELPIHPGAQELHPLRPSRHRQDASGHCYWRESLPDGPEDEIFLRDRAGLEAGQGPQAGHAREPGEGPAETGPPDPR